MPTISVCDFRDRWIAGVGTIQGVMRFMQVDEAVELIKLEYAESPHLVLTTAEARQLWNLSEELCDRALRVLVSSSFLVRRPDGSFVRAEADSLAGTHTGKQGTSTDR
ncbi:MAG TPA: hypothetical protein VH497_01520 [Vicinamibacterales bacterium]